MGGYEKSLPLGVTRASGLCSSREEGWWRGTGGTGRGGGRLDMETPKGPKGPSLPTSTSPKAGLSPSPPCASGVCCPGAGDGQEVATSPRTLVPAMSHHLLLHGNQRSGLLPRGQLQKGAPGCSPRKDAPRFVPSRGILPRALPAEPPGQLRRSDNLPGICNCSPKCRFPSLIATRAETKRGPGLSAPIRHRWEKTFLSNAGHEAAAS